jgi:hypothetical protein
MPNIFDNINNFLTQGLRTVLDKAQACAFCVGYLNLRGWEQVAEVENLPGRNRNLDRYVGNRPVM